MLETSPYAYAKSCGIVGKSFLGKRISSLAGLRSLSELDRLVFPDQTRELSGREMLADLEDRIVKKTVRQIMTIVNSFEDPPELITRMLRSYEYGDLKVCLQHISGGKKEPPEISDIGRFGTVRFSAYPDLNAMLKNTEFKFLLSQELKSVKAGTDIAPVETKIDAFYYNGLINSMAQISAEDRQVAQKILADEISLRNCTWALRLRAYYHKTSGETARNIMRIKLREETEGRKFSLAAEAEESLEFPLDSRPAWKGWKWENFLNPEEASVHWAADPRYFQNAASGYLYRLAAKSFHRVPISVSSVFCFIKLKQFEEDLLTSIAEGLVLGIESAGVFKLLEVV
jgi:vacuolar-type H+-ATPase subunit C/Vma6